MDARLSSIALVLLLLLILILPDVAVSQYAQCRLGKTKLYNCRGKKYDRGNRTADFSNVTSYGRYLIKLKDDISKQIIDTICEDMANEAAFLGTCIYRYKRIWPGMLVRISGENLMVLLDKWHSAIDYVEVEGTFRVNGAVTQQNPPWGLDRIDRLPGQSLLNQLFSSPYSGDGVHVYVLDTGIRCTHQDFLYQDGRTDNYGRKLSRCSGGYDGIRDGYGTTDCNGHGTHCAGIVGGLKSGVAKDALVHPIRSMDCGGSGSYGAIMDGLEWISDNAVSPAVLSMSIATQASISIDQAVNNIVDDIGIVVVAAAGNFLQPACNYSPSRATKVVSVASSNIYNELSWFSNYGTCVTIVAPGELITSASNASDAMFVTMSGTSMACPHVAGVAAVYLGRNPDARPSDVVGAIVDASESSAIKNTKPDTSTRLVNTNLRQPLVDVHPRSIQNGTEGLTYSVHCSLKASPTYSVVLKPYFFDPTIGYFSPSQLTFTAGSSWSVSQTISIILAKNSDFLDHQSKIAWAFISKDLRFNITLEGRMVSRDNDICKWSLSNPCGQTSSNPKIIPSVPFYYIDNSAVYKNVYDESFDSCHNSGPDVVFQYKAASNMVVDISLCDTLTQFDSIMSIYEKTATSLNQISCNDDTCSVQSFISKVPLWKDRTYIIMIDGYDGNSGPFALSITSSTSTIMKEENCKNISSTKRSITRSASAKLNSLWNSNSNKTSAYSNSPSHWKPVAWGPCNKSCGGGVQACNMVSCVTFDYYYGPWSECSQPCGAGVQTREVFCMNNLGHIGEEDRCSAKTLLAVEQNCNTQPCTDPYWEASEWSYCNKPCGEGRAYRDIVCLSNGTYVDDSFCSASYPTTEKICNSQPCQTYSWHVGKWEPCTLDNPFTSREIKCIDGLGSGLSDDSLCNIAMKPENSTSCTGLDMHHLSCEQNGCKGHGRCLEGKCSCSIGWEGTYCERPIACQGRPSGFLPDGQVGCCPHTAVDLKQKCCISPTAKIDVNGWCCNSGNIDACGICDGTNKFVDINSQCCGTIRDEKGICCRSGILDECHICDGDGISCATNFTLAAVVSNDRVDSWNDVLASFISAVAERLFVISEAVVLDGIRVVNGTGNLTSEVEGKISVGTFNLTILPYSSHLSTTMKLQKRDVEASLLRSALAEEQFIPGINIQYIANIRRAGICGNGMCEIGERCNVNGESDSFDGYPCCLEDCPYVLSACPIPLVGPRAMEPCSGNGACLDVSGQCHCYKGYTGLECSHCAVGYVETGNGSCVEAIAGEFSWQTKNSSCIPRRMSP